MGSVVPPIAGSVPRTKPHVVPASAVIAGVCLAWAAWLLHSSYGWRISALLVVGAMAGVVLYHAAFGFTTAWRVFIVGSGSTRMVVTLLAFVPGSVVATAHSAFWGSLPAYPAT